VDFFHPRVFNSDTILDLAFKPQSIKIYGAEVIARTGAIAFSVLIESHRLARWSFRLLNTER